MTNDQQRTTKNKEKKTKFRCFVIKIVIRITCIVSSSLYLISFLSLTFHLKKEQILQFIAYILIEFVPKRSNDEISDATETNYKIIDPRFFRLGSLIFLLSSSIVTTIEFWKCFNYAKQLKENDLTDNFILNRKIVCKIYFSVFFK